MAETDAPLDEAEYRAIEATFGETARGRLFLAEFARRSRKADLAALMTAMNRLREGAPGRNHGDVGGLKARLAEMAAALEQGTGSPAAAGTTSGFEGLAAALRETESATSDILDAAEHIQEIAWTLRERGTERAICDLLDGRSSEIYAACTLHDGAVKRIGQVLRTGRVLEEQIASLCDEWGVRRPASVTGPSPLAAPEAPAPASSAADVGAIPVEDGAPDTWTAAAEHPPAAAKEVEPQALEPDAAPGAAPELSASDRRRKQLAALADIDSLGTLEKLKLFT
jgi:hypothetical protein